MAIMKVRDENGEVKEILALRGERGEKGEQGDYVMVVTEQNGVTSHSAAEIYEACQAGNAVFLKINNRLIPLGDVNAQSSWFYDVQVGGDGARTIEYAVEGDMLVISHDAYSPPVDTSLTQKYVPADAFTVGDRLAKTDKTYANALKGNASGGVVCVDDVSPLTQDLKVNVTAEVGKVKVYGKNLLPFPYYSKSCKPAGLSYIMNDDGSFTVEAGKPTSNANYTFLSSSQTDKNFLKAGTYTFSIGTPNTEPIQFRLGRNKADGTAELLVNFQSGAGISERTFTLAEDSRVYMNCIVGGGNTISKTTTFYPMLEVGTSATDFESYKVPTEYTPNAYGEVDGVTARYPVTTLMTDTEGGIVHVEYTKDTNKVIEKLTQAIISLGGNV